MTKLSTLSDRFDVMNNQELTMLEAFKQVTENDKVDKLAFKRLWYEIIETTDYFNELSETAGQMQKISFYV
jgi:hypothetical protein